MEFGSWIDRCFYRSLIIGLYIIFFFFFFGNSFGLLLFFLLRGKRLPGSARIEFGSVSDVSIYHLLILLPLLFLSYTFLTDRLRFNC